MIALEKNGSHAQVRLRQAEASAAAGDTATP